MEQHAGQSSNTCIIIHLKDLSVIFVFKQILIGLKQNLREEDNLSTRDKWPVPKVSFVRRFYCRPNSQNCHVFIIQCAHVSKKRFSLFSDNTTCPDLFPPYNGYIAYIVGIQDRVGSVAQFSCENGFTLVGNPLLTCMTDGEWDNNLPTCVGKELCKYVPGIHPLL